MEQPPTWPRAVAASFMPFRELPGLLTFCGRLAQSTNAGSTCSAIARETLPVPTLSSSYILEVNQRFFLQTRDGPVGCCVECLGFEPWVVPESCHWRCRGSGGTAGLWLAAKQSESLCCRSGRLRETLQKILGLLRRGGGGWLQDLCLVGHLAFCG